MEGQVTGAFAGGDAARLGLARRQQAFLGVEPVDEDVVRPEVGNVDTAILRMEVDAMRMRAGLAASVRARADMLNRRGRGRKGTVGLDRQGSRRSGPVIHHDQVTAGGVDDEVRRAFTLGGFGVEQT